MKLESKGLKTDLLLSKHMSSVTISDDHIIVDTPDNPEFFWGNYVIFRGSPKLSSLPYYISCFERHFENTPDISHIALTWDDTECVICDELASAFANLGFEVETTSVMTAQNLSPKIEKLKGIEVRQISSDTDWEKVIALQASTLSSFDRDEIYKMLVKRCEQYRCLVESNDGEWFGAFQGDRLLGDLGIIFDDEVARFQNVETHPDFRQRGICKSLVNAAVQYVQACVGPVVFVIEAESGGLAEYIYRGFGFTKSENLVAVCRYDHDNWKA